MAELTTQFDSLNNSIRSLDKALAVLESSSNLIGLDISTAEGLRTAAEAISAELDLLLSLEDSVLDVTSGANDLLDGLDDQAEDSASANANAAVGAVFTPDYEQGIPQELKGICSGDHFQGIRFYDGVSWGYLRLHPEKVELLVGEKYEWPIDGTQPHTYRVTAKGKDIKLYIDGTEVVTATGKFTLPTTRRLIEFGDIAGRKQSVHSAWQSFKYSTEGNFAGDENDEFVLSEIMSLPGGGISAMKSYKGNLYVAFDPDDGNKSSCIYRYQEGFFPERRATVAITRSNITSVVVDPNRPGNVFGTSGKFLGTDRGLQYILGGKPDPLDISTVMAAPPEDNGWRLDENCEGSCRNFFGDILTVDTRDELSEAFHKYVQGPAEAWGQQANNAKGWTVDARVRISEDGGGSPLDLPTFYVPRDYVFVVDTSETMDNGNSLDYSKFLVKSFLSSLHPGDSFNIITFNASAEAWESAPIPASGDNINLAKDFVDSLVPVTGGAKLLEGLQLAVAQSYTHPDKDDGFSPASKGRAIVLVGSGETTNASFSTIPAVITASNSSGPQVAIYSVGVGNQVFAESSAKKKVYVDLAEDNDGESFFVNDYDDVVTRAEEVWEAVAPEVFDWQETGFTASEASTGQRSAFLSSSSEACDTSASVSTPASDLPPPDDGLNAPGIVLNDGTYQEIVQFFEKGVRLKYAKIFARLDLAEEFHTIRIIGRGRAIAVYAKSDSESAFRRIIYAPDSLFVRASSIGAQESPDLTVDSQGVQHAVWQDSKDGTWRIYYAQSNAGNSIDSGRASTSITADISNMLSSRPVFGLPPASIASLPPNAFVAPNASFISKGVIPGDIVAFRSLSSPDGSPIRGGGRYVVSRVINEVAIEVKTTEVLPDLWANSEYEVYRGGGRWSVPSLVSNQPMDSTSPSILAHSSGDIYVAYENVSSGSRDIYIRRGMVGANATAWKESVRMTHAKANNYNPQLVELSNGNVLAVWESNRLDRSRSQIFYAVIDSEQFGVTFDGSGCYSIKSLTPDAQDARNPRISICDQAVPVIVYESLDESGQWHVYAVALDRNNGAGETVQLSDGLDGDNHNPDIAACASRIYVAWENYSTGVGEIMAAHGRCLSFEVEEVTGQLLPVDATEAHQVESGFRVSPFGASIGLTDSDVSSAFSHSFFPSSFGMNIVDYDASGRIISLAQRGRTVGDIGFGAASSSGGIFISGHDADYHAVFTAGAVNLIQKAVEYVSGGAAAPNVLYVTDFRNPLGDQIDGRAGLIAAGLSFTCADAGLTATEPGVVPPNHVDGSLLAPINARAGTAVRDLRTVNFNEYDVIIVASGYGAWFRQDELDILNSRASDILDFVNDGGGLVVWNQSGSRTAYGGPGSYPGPTRDFYKFLPFIDEYALTHGIPSGGVVFDANSLFQITNSRGDSKRPSLSCDLSGNAWIAFEDDRIRDSFFETYVAKYDNKLGRWIGSNQGGMDVRIDMPVQFAKKPSIYTDAFQKSTILFETQLGIAPVQVIGSVVYDDIPTFDESVVGFFPLDETTGSRVLNRVVNSNSTEPAGGDTSHDASVLSVQAPDSGVSLFNPALQNAMRLDQAGKAVKIDKSLLFSTGAIDVWLTPHWASTDTTARVIWGTASASSLAPNTMSLSVGPSGGGNELKFRIVDDAGNVRYTTVKNDGPQNFVWDANQSVHVRAVWDEDAIGVSTMNSVSFLSTSVGLAVGPNGAIYRTTNGGQTWSRIESGVTYDLYSVDYASASLVLACGEFGTILKSTDGGISWSVIDLGVSQDINSVFHNISTGTSYAVGAAGSIFRSTDSGATWVAVKSPSVGDLNCVATIYDGSTTAVVAVGTYAQIIRSTDDGLTWASVTPPGGINAHLNYVTRSHQASAADGFVSGNKGTILKTTNAGSSWADVSFSWGIGYQPNLLSVSHSDDDANVYVVGQNGSMAKSYDGGVTWIETATALSQGALKCIDAWMGGTTTNLIAIGSGGSVLASSDKAVVQKYYIIKSGNLTIYIDGKEPAQERSGDSTFSWDPSGSDLYLGDYRFSGSDSANATFDEVIIYNGTPTSGSIFRRANLLSRRFDSPNRIVTQDESKRIEWGNISPLSKARSHWASFGVSFCGAKEPVMHFQWPGQLGFVDDVIRDMVADRSGFLWVATENGIGRVGIEEVNDDIERFVSGQASLPNKTRFVNYTNLGDGLPTDSISSITVDGNNDIWAGSAIGLLHLKRDNVGFADSSSDPAQKAFFAENPELVTGAEKDASSDAISTQEPKDVTITLLTMDNGLPSNNVTVVRAFKNIIYVGTDSGLAVITTEATESNADNPPGGSQGVSPSEGAATSVDAGSSSAVDEARLSTSETAKAGGTAGDKLSSPSATQAANVEEVGSGGANILVQTFTVLDGMPSNLIQSISYDEDAKEALVGTDNGLVRLSRDGRIIAVNSSSGLISNNIFSITIDKATKKKYVGTSMGITVIDGMDFVSYPPSAGIGYGAIHSGDIDGTGAVWFGVSTGLVEFNQSCDVPKFTLYDYRDGIIGDPNILDFQRFRILGGAIPSGGCEKALVAVSVNGRRLSSGYDVVPHVPWIVFDTPLGPSDKVDVCVHKGWRKVKCFDSDSLDRKELAQLTTERLRMPLYRKRFEAGTVSLGGNTAQGASKGSSMYFVIVAPLDGSGTTISSISLPAGASRIASLEKGLSIYSDSSEEILLFPTGFAGTEAIAMPAADEGVELDEYLEFELAREAIVYVAYDFKSQALPGWLRSFQPVEATYRVTDMEVFSDASGEEKLFVSLAGTNGCVYELLSAPEACDISDSIALDALPPEGCAKITRLNSPTSATLEIEATDAVTGVQDMQVAVTPNFTEENEDGDIEEVDWVPFQNNFILAIPPSAISDVTEIATTVTVDFPNISFTKFFNWNGKILIATKNPGRVYELNRSTLALTLLFETGESEVLSMTSFGQYLLVGTGTNGRAFLWNGTTLQLITLPGGERITATAAFDTRAFFGTSPEGKIYEMDTSLNVQLFMDTFETDINGFAIFGGRLYWVSGNTSISEGDVLNTTTTDGHRHAFSVLAGTTDLSDASGTTSVVDGHSHSIVGGVVQEAMGHTHALIGSSAGKVFRYDAASGSSAIVHSDRDHRVASIVSTSQDASGLMFVGTEPNGRILRFVPDENIFIKSFDTTAESISSMKVVNGEVNASADEDIFVFDGRRWIFQTSVESDISDILEVDGNMLVLSGAKIFTTTITRNTVDVPTRKLCAFVRFRDAAGNISKITDESGAVVPCYNPCVEIQGSRIVSTNEDETGSGGGVPGGGGTVEVTLPPIVHRITEIDSNAKVVRLYEGPEPFLSANKVESEIGVYESEVFNGTNSLVQWVSLSWLGNAPLGTSISIAVRTSSTLAGIVDAEWGSEFTSSTSNDLTNLTGQFLQFRATLKVTEPGAQSPELYKVDIQLRTSQAVHYFTTNFALPDEIKRGILTFNGCLNPPATDIVFAISGQDTVDFSDYYPIVPNKVFELPPEHQRKNLRVGIKLISSPTTVPVVDEFALLFSLANDAIIRLNLPGMPTTIGTLPVSGDTRTVLTEEVQGHTHSVTFDSSITDVSGINGTTSANSGHSHDIVNGVVQQSAGHSHGLGI